MTDFNGVVAEYVYKTDDIILPENAQAFQFPDTEKFGWMPELIGGEWFKEDEMKEETITSEELAQAHARINKIVHRSDCQNHDTDECFGCKLAECYESIRELISELNNPQRDGEDKHQVDSIIEKAKRKLPEFLGMRFGNHYIGGAK